MEDINNKNRKRLIERLKKSKSIMYKFTFPFVNKDLTKEDHIRIEKEMSYWIDFLAKAQTKQEKIHKEIQEKRLNNMQYTEEHWKTRSELVRAILDKDLDKVSELIKKSIELEKQANNKL